MGDELFQILLTRVLPIALAALVGFLFERYRDPLKTLKELAGSPIMSIMATAAVLVAEVLWSEHDGEFQLKKAIEMLAKWSRGLLTVEQAGEIVLIVYQSLKDLLGDHWDDLKLALMSQAGSAGAG